MCWMLLVIFVFANEWSRWVYIMKWDLEVCSEADGKLKLQEVILLRLLNIVCQRCYGTQSWKVSLFHIKMKVYNYYDYYYYHNIIIMTLSRTLQNLQFVAVHFLSDSEERKLAGTFYSKLTARHSRLGFYAKSRASWITFFRYWSVKATPDHHMFDWHHDQTCRTVDIILGFLFMSSWISSCRPVSDL